MEQYTDDAGNIFTSKTLVGKKGSIITMCGLIGAGKTTLANGLAKYMELPVYYELKDKNPYLERFYQNMREGAFPLQMQLLNMRSSQYEKIINTTECGIIDRSIYEDQIFAKVLYNDGLINPLDYQLYLDYSNKTIYKLIKPKVVIWLDVSPEVAMERIQRRNREMEKKSSGLTIEYLKKLNDEYQHFVPELAKDVPVIKIDWNQSRFFENNDEIIKNIADKIKNMIYLTSIDFV